MSIGEVYRKNEKCKFLGFLWRNKLELHRRNKNELLREFIKNYNRVKEKYGGDFSKYA